MADDQKSFWTTLPGLFTGLAALISAAAGLIAVFNAHPSTPAPQPTPPVVTQNIPPVTKGTPVRPNQTMLTGFWSGSTEGLKMAVLNLEGAGPNLSGTFERPCVSNRVYDIESAIHQGANLTVTIAHLPPARKNQPPPAPIEMDLKHEGGKLTGTFNQGNRHSPITLTPGRQTCPTGQNE
jgi:hypothetical protein